MSTTRHTAPASPRPRRTARRLLAAALVATTAFAVTACGNDDDESAAPTTEAAPASTAAPDTVAVLQTTTHATHAEEGGDADSMTIGVDAVDYAFRDLPGSVPVGTKLTLRNRAPAELHELVAIRLPDTESRPVAELLRLPEAELGALMSSAPPAAVLLAAPGGEQIAAVGDGTLTEPGRYVVLCAIPTGADPQEYLSAAAASNGEPPKVAGGAPHFANGMFAELVVG